MFRRRTRNTRTALLEALEPRTLLSVSIIAKSATFTDVDGDQVTVAITLGSLSAGTFTTAPSGLGDQLQVIDLTAPAFEGTNLSITVTRAATSSGDGLVNIGYINATGRNLGSVTVAGDLGRIDAGTGRPLLPAIKSLTVFSLGRLGLDSQGGSGNLTSTINGHLTSLNVKSDMQDALLLVNGNIGSLTIGGSLRGGQAASSGAIITTGAVTSLKIGGDVVGGAGLSSGIITATHNLGSVKIAGSLIGGSGDNAGFISSQAQISSLTLGGSLLGGTGDNAGQITAVGKILSLTLGGSLLGGLGDDSGAILAQSDINSLKIGQDLIGASVASSVTLTGSAYIESLGRIGNLTIGGSIITGISSGGGTLAQNASIRAANDIGSLTVKGSLLGNAANPVILSARGQATSVTSDRAFGGITVSGRVQFANILAGYTTALAPTNGDAQIGNVKVGGDWVASNLVAGIMNTASSNTLFGDANDTSIGPGKAGITASIGSITITGYLYGTPASTNAGDHFGFASQKILALKVANISQHLTSGKDTLTLSPTLDITLHEL